MDSQRLPQSYAPQFPSPSSADQFPGFPSVPTQSQAPLPMQPQSTQYHLGQGSTGYPNQVPIYRNPEGPHQASVANQFHGFPSAPTQSQAPVVDQTHAYGLPGLYQGFPQVPTQTTTPVTGSGHTPCIAISTSGVCQQEGGPQASDYDKRPVGAPTVGRVDASGYPAVRVSPLAQFGGTQGGEPSLELGFASRESVRHMMPNHPSMSETQRNVASAAPVASAKPLGVNLGDLIGFPRNEHGYGVPEPRRNSRALSPMSLMDLDPIPITGVGIGAGTEKAQAMSSTLIDVFSPTAREATPFVSTAVASHGEPPGTPRTPRVGTSGGAQHTPGGTRVPEGPPPPVSLYHHRQ